ncbi:type II toxin-antitoxin system prevent-host-death family antitoxin [Umezawaea sp. Da 62-37]|uniref:type II toxin-antitoxin system Phd/YefM family antitoxin n=1 Tax=Umezawaea sp. Da 62-37 TaxID=3075927 RepID=UPI0028F721C7|nr:type II toxin-antitoxin system prevent-host-death family antitoxin [Umezawaea sp. Da 62-37]WNV89850.1 type II toxin-antitoxin system prevent-host-death family antitoxin [Umezawaea sp. Da 62-37]
MESIGVRELRQNASVYLRRVAAGESITVTDRGVPVAVLAPPPRDVTLRERLRQSGELLPADGSRATLLEPPLESDLDVSAELDALREDRF